jgi:hypothetical protein
MRERMSGYRVGDSLVTPKPKPSVTDTVHRRPTQFVYLDGQIMLELAGIVIGAAIAMATSVLWWLWQLWQTLKLVYQHLPVTPRPWPSVSSPWLRLRAARHIATVILRSVELSARDHVETLRRGRAIAPRLFQ